MERRGFEPLTLTLPVSRATNCANAPCEEVIQLSKPLGAGAAPLQIRYLIEFAGSQPTPLSKIYLIVKAFRIYHCHSEALAEESPQHLNESLRVASCLIIPLIFCRHCSG